MAFFALNASLPVLIGIARPDTVKLVAFRVVFKAIFAPARFPAAHTGTIFRFCVVGILVTDKGMGAVAIGTRHVPVVLARVCFPICTPTNPAHGGRCAIRIPKVAAVFRLGVAGVARAGAGVGFISVGCPAVPVMTQLGIRTALGAGGIVVAGRYAESAILRFGVVAVVSASAGVGASADGLPLAPVVRPVITEELGTHSTFRQSRARSFCPRRTPMILCKLLIAVVTVQCMLILGSTAQLKGIAITIVAVRPAMPGHRGGCYKEQRNRQETCNQPFFHVFLLLKSLVFPAPKTAGRKQRARVRRLIDSII